MMITNKCQIKKYKRILSKKSITKDEIQYMQGLYYFNLILPTFFTFEFTYLTIHLILKMS
jgi:hypothetical protein